MDPMIQVEHLVKRYRKAALPAVAVTVGFFLVFTIVGTFMFVRTDRNR